MKVKIYAVALLALTLSGCDNDQMENLLADGPVAMTFTADINSVATRATTTGFEAGDMVGIIPLKGNVVEKTQTNIAYTYDGSAFTAAPPYYFQNYDEVTFNAYYPHQSALNDPYTVKIDTRIDNQATEMVNGNNWRKNDYLFASTKTTVKTSSISFTEAAGNPFKHVMSSVAVDFKAGIEDGVANLKPLMGYTLGKVVMDGTFNCSTGTVSLKANVESEDITITDISCAESDTEYQTSSLILLPQDVAGGKFSLTVNFNNTTYTADLTLSELQAGKLHVFPVTIKNTKLEIGTAEIKDWETSTEYNGAATLQ
jgi:hypothetical protein